ncbi:MAG: HAMP domain-containing protein [Nitrospirae bacterium]|nr:HAMP domain-containing protein [Nitrospirota bacterium]
MSKRLGFKIGFIIFALLLGGFILSGLFTIYIAGKNLVQSYETLMRVAIIAVLFALIVSLALWLFMRKLVLMPVKAMESAAAKLADGDLSFAVDVSTGDEISQLGQHIHESVNSLSRIIKMVRDISLRAAQVSKGIEGYSREMIDGTQLEADAVSDISSSVEELNAAISEITDGTEGFAASADATAAAMDEIATTTVQISSSTYDLSSSIEATSSSIEELSATIKEVAKNADNLSAVSEDTLAAVEEITASVKDVESSAKESAHLTEKVMKETSTLGIASIEKTMAGMNNIKSSVEKTNELVQRLGNRSVEIGKILNVINDITDQTTLLALNVAILAAQAGEHGRGFSVVADEIKDLAERTTFSTQEINALIQSIQQEVKSTVQAMGEGLISVHEGLKLSKEASDALQKILGSAQKSSEMAFAIERYTVEQSRAVKFVSNTMEQIKDMTGLIAKTTSEQSKGIILIMNATEKIKDASNQVKKAMKEQEGNSKHVSQAVGVISDKSQQISSAIYEQKIGTNQICSAVEKIKDVPRRNRDLALNINNSLQDILKDIEAIEADIKKFRFS